jgi:hypothetical protein
VEDIKFDQFSEYNGPTATAPKKKPVEEPKASLDDIMSQ